MRHTRTRTRIFGPGEEDGKEGEGTREYGVAQRSSRPGARASARTKVSRRCFAAGLGCASVARRGLGSGRYTFRVARMSDSVRVAVRLRPYIHKYEINVETGKPLPHVKKCVSMKPPQTIVTDPKTGKQQTFTYDFSYDSFDPASKDYASQEVVLKQNTVLFYH